MTDDVTVAQHLANELARRGVSHVFELVGGMVVALLDEVHQQKRVNVVSMRHEQAAGFAAEGWARMRGTPGVALATSGPGATNLLTAVASCYFDSVPMVFVTGQVNRNERRVPGRGRQGGFQETDIVSMAAPITKLAVSVERGFEFPRVLDDAWALAMSGRPGPVLLDIPLDVQREAVGHVVADPPVQSQLPTIGADPERTEFVMCLRDQIARSERPLILVGGGLRASGAVPRFRTALRTVDIPVVHSLLGLDVVPSDFEQRVGMIGSYGNRWANRAVAACDVLVVLGSRLDVRQTGSDLEGFARGRQIFQVDVDAGEIGARVPVNGWSDDLATFLSSGALDHVLPHDGGAGWQQWRTTINTWRRDMPDTAENVPARGPNPNALLAQAQTAWPDVAAWVSDVGQHQMWFAQSAHPLEHQRILTSGGLGAMGFALPAAIGSCLASAAPVALVAGDGGFQLNIQELQTLVHHQLPVRMIVMNNGSHGMVRQFQSSYFGGRHGSSVDGYSAPSFSAVAQAFGVPSRTVGELHECQEAFAWASDQQGPVLIEVHIDAQLNAMPKMAFGRAFGDMEPDVEPTSFGAE